ncbi:hypothetical protein, partial [Streptococcus pneumoniae]|uniref:hypothetical protein n=1 Tax=Streptococcus pneumoniae TaxID=1313 RepID=UPI001CB778B8
MVKDQIASTSFSIELNKILADKYKDKVDSDSTDSKDNTLISSKAGNVTVKDVMDKIGKRS